MQTGRWLSLKTENDISFACRPRISSAAHDKDVMDFRFSSSGRYGFLVRDRPVRPSSSEPTHYYEISFTVMDTFRGTLKRYSFIDSIFRTYHRFYLLSENVGVLLDFSRHHSIITQHFLYFDHQKAEVSCEFLRRWSFGVDEMLAGTDGTYVPGTSQLLQINGERYVPLLGQLDRLVGYIIMRIVPADPRCVSDASRRHSSRLFLFNPTVLTSSPHTRVRVPSGEEFRLGKHAMGSVSGTLTGNNYNGDDLSFASRHVVGCTTDYPFIYGSGIFFFVSRSVNEPAYVEANSAEPPLSLCIKWMLEVDIVGLLATELPSDVSAAESPSGRRISFSNALRRIQLSARRNQAEPISPAVNSRLFRVGEQEYTSASGRGGNAIVELIQRGMSFVSLRLIDISRTEVVTERDVIEMYTYIQAGSNVYVRIQFRPQSHNIFSMVRSKWICLDLKKWQWTSFFRQPCRARIPFWFCGIPDGRAFFYRQVWKRGTKEVIARQFRVMMPPRNVLLLRQLAFLKHGCAEHEALRTTKTCPECHISPKFHRHYSVAGGDNRVILTPSRSFAMSKRETDTADRRRCEVDALLSQYERLFHLFEPF